MGKYIQTYQRPKCVRDERGRTGPCRTRRATPARVDRCVRARSIIRCVGQSVRPSRARGRPAVRWCMRVVRACVHRSIMRRCIRHAVAYVRSFVERPTDGPTDGPRARTIVNRRSPPPPGLPDRRTRHRTTTRRDRRTVRTGPTERFASDSGQTDETRRSMDHERNEYERKNERTKRPDGRPGPAMMHACKPARLSCHDRLVRPSI